MPQPSFSDNYLEFPGKQAGYRAQMQSPCWATRSVSERDGAASPPPPGGLRRAASGYRVRAGNL